MSGERDEKNLTGGGKSYMGLTPQEELEKISEKLDRQTEQMTAEFQAEKPAVRAGQKEHRPAEDNRTAALFWRKERPYYLAGFLYYLCSFLYLEVMFHIHQYGSMDGFFLFSLLFIIPAAAVYTLISSIGGRKCRKIISFVLMSVTVLLYFAYLVYYFIFKAYLSVYSITTGTGQVLEFWREILNAVNSCLPWLLVFAIPIPWLGILYYMIRKHREKVLANQMQEFGDAGGLLNGSIRGIEMRHYKAEAGRTARKYRLLWTGGLIAGTIVLHTILVLSLPLFGKELYSPYDLYHYTSAMELSVKELGLLTSVRLDVKRLLFGMPEAPVDFVEPGWEDELPEPPPDQTPPDSGLPPDDSQQTGGSDGEESAGGNTETATSPAVDIASGDAVEAPATVDRSPNILNFNFNKLAKKAPNEGVANLHKYFETVAPTDKNEYTGMFEGYNLILITAEGFSPYAIDEKLTPTLYKLSTEGFVFRNFYTPLWGVSTSDGEYVACTGLIPKSGVWSMYKSGANAMPFAFGNQFGKLGYHCRAYHDHSFDYYRRDISHPNLGYDYKAVGNGLEIKESWPESDLEMMEVTVPEYVEDQPFHTYYMTVSGHMYYTFMGNAMSYKHKREVEELPYSEEARAYIACNIELDHALEKLIADLTDAGIADHTVIALSADHYPYGLPKESLDELAGHTVEENFEIYRNSFFLWTASIKEPIVVDKPASSLDIAPTLSNLFGLAYDSRLYMGRDILSDSPGLVIFSNRSFISDLAMYNSTTKEVTELTDVELPEDYISTMNKAINNKFKYSAEILDQDYYQYLLPYLK